MSSPSVGPVARQEERRGPGILEPLRQQRLGIGPGDRLEPVAAPPHGLREAVRIVEPLERRMPARAEGTSRDRVVRIPLELDRPPSMVFTQTPHPAEHSPHAVAYQVATPGVISSGGTT
jgi:hypothetical protein